MSAQQLDKLCQEAMQRIGMLINRMAGQHLRRMRESWGKQP